MKTDNGNQTTVRNIQIRQTYIEEQVNHILNYYDYEKESEAFQALVLGLLFDTDYDSIDPAEIVDGGQDKQIDIIKIEDDQEQGAHIHIIQAKNTNGFSSNILTLMRNGMEWLFERPKAEYSQLANIALVNKIDEIRQLRLDYGVSNLSVSVYFVTIADTTGLSDEFLQERSVLLGLYSNAGFKEFNFREIGAFELVELLDDSERIKRKVDVEIPIVYDINQPSLLSFQAGDTRALICTVTGMSLAEAASHEPRDAIFDLNVRPFYGDRGKVNSDIHETCTNDESPRFWFLNNGITMTCDKYDLVRDPDSAHVKVFNAQIVNGCQTTVTLREALERKELKDDVKVLLRIYATDNPSLTERITLTTNNQNRITDRDLRANDEVQRDIQRVMQERYGHFYERKNKEFRSLSGAKKKHVVPNTKAAQAYLAIVRQKPSTAYGFLGKIWSDFYNEVFGNATVTDMLFSYKIYDFCHQQAKRARKELSVTRVSSEVAVYGVFHLARICGFLLANDKWGKKNQEQVDQLITKISNDLSLLNSTYAEAKKILIEIRENHQSEFPNPTLYFKASVVQRDIAKEIAKLKEDD